ncbi:class I SAM-dependent methyltransferase [Actinokineospora xionganensis]|uniref:Class I SAM-dependent methyltransferase n=1 Tax=Actinokineospora xionganensis TaxID=2684470 RepID=A0ABR7LF33_9PSEU|nr:class I SAM-dependent methyltransferase [Actinokineospora xionganensis]MBC6451203.1 class I SAM-dependent methyltransferase [Actinokineospora xionganensis]
MSFAPEWLALREKADADARAEGLLDPLRESPLNRNPLLVRDIGCGTGSMGRWLSGRLGGRQHWVLHDRDPRLLAVAGATVTGPGVTVETREGDLTALRAEDLEGTSLLTASALLDLLTAEEVDSLAAACVDADCPALLTLSVAGRVELDPPERLDAEFTEAFNEHQRREVDGRRLLGPDAVAAAVDSFERRGAMVWTRPSPWRLGPDQAALAGEWLRGWVGAACEQRPALAAAAPAYLRRRLTGGMRVVVEHVDLLALPRST